MATPVERKAARTVGAGVVVLAVTLAMLYITFQAQTGNPFAATTEVKAATTDVHSLRVNDDVRANSKRIGRVSDLEFTDDGLALVTMEIQGELPVYNDATAAIFDYSALATKFVELDPGEPQSGPLGDRVLPASQTDDSKDIKEVLDVFDAPTRQGTMSTVREVGGGLMGRAPDLQSFLSTAPVLFRNLGTVSRSLSTPRADLASLLRSANGLTGSLAVRDEQLSALLDQTDTTFKALTADSAAPLGEALDLAPATLRTVRPALARLDRPLADAEEAVRTLQPGAVALGRATPDVRGILKEGVPVLDKVPDVADTAEPALEDLTATSEDLRPLAPRAVETLDSLNTFLDGLSPYGTEIGQWAVRVNSFVSEGPEPGARFARVGPSPAAGSVTSGLFPSGANNVDQYPAPGQMTKQRQRSGPVPGLPGVVPAIPGLGGGNR